MYIHTYIHKYIHTYIHTYIRTYIHTYITSISITVKCLKKTLKVIGQLMQYITVIAMTTYLCCHCLELIETWHVSNILFEFHNMCSGSKVWGERGEGEVWG